LVLYHFPFSEFYVFGQEAILLGAGVSGLGGCGLVVVFWHYDYIEVSHLLIMTILPQPNQSPEPPLARFVPPSRLTVLAAWLTCYE